MSRQPPLVPADKACADLTIKKSRFIAQADHARSRAEAMAVVAQVRRAYPDARHHCWAYLFGDPESSAGAGMSDDGEPSGTAGKPILNVIQHKNISDVVVVVSRYFGGIKLGAGGLVRAYSGVTESVLSALPLCRHTPRSKHTLQADFAHEQVIRHWCAQNNAGVDTVAYGTRVTLQLDVPDGAVTTLRAFCEARAITLS